MHMIGVVPCDAGNGKTANAALLTRCYLWSEREGMTNRFFSEKVILHAVDQYLHGDVPAEAICAKLKISAETFDAWCRRYALLTWSEALFETQELKKENARLRKLISDLNKPSMN